MHTPAAFRPPLHALGVAVAVTLVLLGSACGTPTGAGTNGTATTTSAALEPRPVATIDRLVDIGTGRLHLRCAGTGAATVVLIAGWGDGGDGWGEVETSLRQDARVCAYARFGTGTSDPPPSTQTFTTQADDLHMLLDAAGEPGPYMVVGHSFGGAEAVAFASRYDEEVSGLALLDTSPMTWPQAVCAVPDDGSDMAAIFKSTCEQMSDATANPEHLDALAAFDEAAMTPSLGAVPMVVLTRAAPTYAGLADAAAQSLAKTWTAGQDHWAALSSKSKVVPVDTQEHDLHRVEPALVVEEIRSLLG